MTLDPYKEFSTELNNIVRIMYFSLRYMMEKFDIPHECAAFLWVKSRGSYVPELTNTMMHNMIEKGLLTRNGAQKLSKAYIVTDKVEEAIEEAKEFFTL